MNFRRATSSGRHDLRNLGLASSDRGSGGSEPLLFGAQNQAPNGHTATWLASKVKIDRGSWTQFSYNEAEVIHNVEVEYAKSVAAGCLPMGMVNCKNEYLGTITPATFATKYREIVEKMKTLNPGQPYYYLAVINEPYNCGEKGSNAKEYALICKAVYEDLEAHSIPLWPTAGGVMVAVFCHLTYQLKTSEKVAGAFSDYTLGAGWMRDFVTNWPGSVSKVNAFEIHPYGRPEIAASAEGNDNIASGKLQREQAIAAGFTVGTCPGINNFWVGEVGYNVGGGGPLVTVPTNEAQATELQKALEQMSVWKNEGWLKAITVFADGLTEWGIWGKPAQATLEAYARAHG